MFRGQGGVVGLLRFSCAAPMRSPVCGLTWIRPTATLSSHEQSRLCFVSASPQRYLAFKTHIHADFGGPHARIRRADRLDALDDFYVTRRAPNLSLGLFHISHRLAGSNTRLGSGTSCGERSSSTTCNGRDIESKGNLRSQGEGGAAPAGMGTESSRPQEDVNKMGKLRLMVKRYGAVAVITYLGVYVVTLSALFAAVESGLTPFDYGLDSNWLVEKATHLLENYSWSEPLVETIQTNPHAGNFAVAWVLTKFTEPLRMILTIAVVPRIARVLGRAPS
ncbi:hypothetical protein NGA_2087520 [Nannochloropsis gaditana CCMP526]|uniref:uncharacterized protein n=1 Tax=Nannochloropsis gaditana (strain CCMP526) TaxID=1093141 RepID=UPI00029F7491|nr:hypothetical protein NGA_2087520 [Nannochloropsis gaditana CCMP526]XP_005856007.1 hypothetical protein NGA_2087510 [Nannochloropsis gaditana CCMP526]EKU20355.1 hypothetical protein NGA_2087510 [Nannochloropsis gaditana CCMP526]EKU20477.1 hypothetical protein NGA_2087520 [Nannochloropsis gaditana CCMP526]|eukprot:XP_005855884.1 hypothetical protein NGA_2087520 [Nannochloropsis gaditana CCMP526]